jgi:Cu(I)/Ag(I) efflux system membrane fusion protein
MELTQDSEVSAAVSSASVTGTINSLMIDHGMINISRSAIEKWDRPAAMVDFITGKGVNLTGFSEGMEVEFIFEIRDGNFVIVEISQTTNSEQPVNSALNEESGVDHSNH